METAIDNASTIEAVEALFTYTKGEDDVFSRPLGEWPKLQFPFVRQPFSLYSSRDMLQKIQFLPGFNKQVTATGAEGQWIDGDNVRFRYNTPEKIGGWAQLGESKLTGASRKTHHIIKYKHLHKCFKLILNDYLK